jgi:nucleotide-binding universal stress UspA family protein
MNPMAIEPLGTVLCPVDLSDQSRIALYQAAGFAWRARLVVLRVDPRADGSDDERMDAQLELQQFVTKALPGRFGYHERTEIIVRSGDPADVILAAAREFDADAIVMATRGRGLVSRALLGSTTERIVKESTIPVLVVPPSGPEIVSLDGDQPAYHVGVILVPVDLDAPHERQLAWAGRLSGASPHRLLVMNVVPEGSSQEHAQERLNGALRGLASAKGARMLIREGRAAEQVPYIARNENVGLVILGRSNVAPGKIAYELMRSGRAVVMMVP